MSKPNKSVMIFIRPQEAPTFTVEEKNVRVAYRNQWIDFRDGKILIKSEDE